MERRVYVLTDIEAGDEKYVEMTVEQANVIQKFIDWADWNDQFKISQVPIDNIEKW